MTLNAWGIDDTKDVLQAVDLVVERGLADPDRLAISGGSYGGFIYRTPLEADGSS